MRSWALFDWAAQPFHTLILTFVFGPYVTSTALTSETAKRVLGSVGLGFLADPAATGDANQQIVWSVMLGVIGVLTALASPVLGAMADATGPRKPWIAAFSVLAIVGSIGLWVLPPGAGVAATWWMILAFALAFFGFEFATVFTNAMMPDLVPRSEIGRLSGNAWALGYVGGLVSLVLVLGLMATQPGETVTLLGLDPILGLDPANAEGTRAAGPLTGLWYAVFVLPLFLFTPDAPRRLRIAGAIGRGLAELRETIRTLPSQRSLFAFLGSSMLYRDALNGLYAFGGIYAAGVLDWPIVRVGVFGIITALIGAVGAWIGGKLDARFGPRAVVTWAIVALMAVSFTVVTTTPETVLFMEVGTTLPAVDLDLPLLGAIGMPDLAFLFCGAVIGAAGGALQAASRTLLIDQADPARMTEAFGLYALSGKATSFLAPLLIAAFTAIFASQRVGVTPLIGLFAAGLGLLAFVRYREPRS